MTAGLSVLTLAAWLSCNGQVKVDSLAELPAGPLPVRLGLEALSKLDGRLFMYDDPDLALQVACSLHTLRIDVEHRDTIELLLRTAGVYLLTIDGSDGTVWNYATRSPKRLPRFELPYRIELVSARHQDVEAIAEALRRDIERSEADIEDVDRRTRVIPDARTQKLMIRYTSEELLQRYLRLFDQLDAPPQPSDQQLVLESWRCRHQTAPELQSRFEKAWRHAPLHVVAHRKSNTLLFRLPRAQWPEVEAMLRQLDRP